MAYSFILKQKATFIGIQSMSFMSILTVSVTDSSGIQIIHCLRSLGHAFFFFLLLSMIPHHDSFRFINQSSIVLL